MMKIINMFKHLNSIFKSTNFIRYAIGIGVVVLGAVVIGMVVETCIYEYHDVKQRKTAVLLKILPKRSADVVETRKLIKNLHSMLLNTKFRKIKFGRPYMSFEIAATGGEKGKINFYIWVPKDMKDRIVDRIYATYPDVAIELVERDYIPKLDKVYCYSSELGLAYNHIRKIKNDPKTDILGSIISGMKDLKQGEFNAVQLVARPLDNSWQVKGRKELARFEREGIRPGEAAGASNRFQAAFHKGLSEIDDAMHEQGFSTNLSGGFGDSSYGISNKKTKLDRGEIVSSAEKLSEPGFEVAIRVIALGRYKKGNTARVKAISAAFNELDGENRFKKQLVVNHEYVFNKFKNRLPYRELNGKRTILTPGELSNVFLRLPGEQLIDKFRQIEKISIKEFEAPYGSKSSGKGVVFALNTYRGEKNIIEIKDKDVMRHIVVQGRIGSGKSEWAKTPFLDQISNKRDENGNIIRKGRGAMLLEPHGKLADEMLQIIPEDRWKDTIVFDLFSEYPWPFNFCKVPDRESDVLNKEQLMQKTVDEAIEIFKRQFSDVWTEKNEFYIINSIKAIMETGHTMVELPRMFSDKEFRKSVIPYIKDPKVKKFWTTKFKENAQGKIDSSVESTAQSVEYKFEKFLSSKELVRVLGQNDCIDFKEILDNDKIIIFKFSKDKMSRDRISFLGGIAMKLLTVGAFARDKSKWDDPFLVFIDEAQNFINESIKEVYYELRKYGIGLILMHQELEQLNEVPGLENAIYNNVGTSITFTTGELDAPFFANKYAPRVDEKDLTQLPSRYGYCKLMVNGRTSDTFNIYSLDSPSVTAEEGKRAVETIMSYNNKGKMHISEIDEMIKARFEDTNDSIDDNESGFSIDVKEESQENEIENAEEQQVTKNKKSVWD